MRKVRHDLWREMQYEDVRQLQVRSTNLLFAKCQNVAIDLVHPRTLSVSESSIIYILIQCNFTSNFEAMQLFISANGV